MKYVKVKDNIHDDWSDVSEKVEKVYDGPSAIVAKPTRLGFTSIIAKIAEMRNDNLLIITPTNKIKETILKACPSALPIFGHKGCKWLQDHIEELVLEIGAPLPGICPRIGACDYNPNCEMHRAWHEDACVRMLTYSKLETLMYVYSPSKTSEIALLRERLKNTTTVMCDESDIISLESSPSVDLNYTIKNIPEDFINIRKIYSDYCELCHKLYNDQMIKTLDATKDHCKTEAFLSFPYENYAIINTEVLTYAYAELRRLANARAAFHFSDDDIRFLKDVISVMTCRSITINLVTSNNGATYSIKGKPTANSPTIRNAISLFLKQVCPTAKVFFVSGSQFEKYPGMFSEIADRELAHICVPDVKQNNSKMTIVPDTWKYSSVVINGKDFSGTQDKRIKEKIMNVLAMHSNEPIYIICFNKMLQVKILSWKLPLPEGSLVDYYRSSNSIGVECKARIGIAIGTAKTPINTFDFATDNVAESRSLRLQGEHAATFQAWSRIKDPEGKVPSILYCVGVRSDEVSAITRQGSNRIVIYNGKDEKNRHIPPTITLSEELPKPKILMEARTKIALEPRKVSSELYIDCVVPLSDRIKDELVGLRLALSLKHQQYHIYNSICEKVGVLNSVDYKFYNPGQSPDWKENNLLLFYTNIITRPDKCGLQAHTPDSKGKHAYPNALLTMPLNELLDKHFDGIETIALPPFDTNDMCYWCAVDFDDHDSITPQTSNVMKFGSYLRSLSVPYFVLLSGSNLGYHVWILLDPCKTYTAYKFIRQVLHDAGIPESKDIEPYPKQKTVSKSSKAYGGSLKLPNAYNWKAGRRSMLVDPITLEPVPYVSIPGVLRLHEINEVPVEHREINQKEVRHIPVNCEIKDISVVDYENDGRVSGNIRPCLIKALDQQLTGGKGNMTRVVIAVEAVNAGMPRDLVIDLFRSQSDFVYETTAAKVDFAILKKYHNWKCSTIHDQCGEFVDCENCPTCKLEIT
jgi:hypothetical protein